MINYLVIHYTVSNLLRTLNTFTEKANSGRVSAHYVVSELEELGNGIKIPAGIIFRVVPEQFRAWHAGLSAWGTVKNLNPYAIGIELVNKGFVGEYTSSDCQWFPFDSVQMEVAERLMENIIKRYEILPFNIVAHADIAPTRKQDPGKYFDWTKLYRGIRQIGFGLYESEVAEPNNIVASYTPKEPLPQGTSFEFIASNFTEDGYNFPDSLFGLTAENKAVLIASRMHFTNNMHPEAQLNREPDREDMLWSWGLSAKKAFKLRAEEENLPQSKRGKFTTRLS